MTMPAQFPALQQRGLAKFIKLALDFSENDTLDPRITFSRTSNATRTNAQGLIEYAPHNLLTYSEQFDNAAWVKSNATVTANAVVAPDGTTTADKLVEDTATSSHGMLATFSPTDNTTYVVSMYLKASERSKIIVTLVTKGGGLRGRLFDLANGTSQQPTIAGYSTIPSVYGITPIGDGWYRCYVGHDVGTGTVVTNNVRYSIVLDGSSATYTGDGTSGIYIWGAQLNIDSLQPYYTTSVKNLLGYSQNFDNAAWTKSNSNVLTNLLTYSQEFENAAWVKTNATITPNIAISPDGTTTADNYVATAVSGEHINDQVFTSAIGNTYTCSCYVKANGLTDIGLRFTVGTLWTGSASPQVRFNLTTQVASIIGGTPAGYNIVSMGNGWYRISMSAVCIAAGTPSARLQLMQGPSNVFTGDGTSGIYIWGAQLVQGTNPEEYTVTTSAPAPIQVMGPLGFLGAEKLVENTAAGVPHGLAVDTNSLNSTTQYTFSVYAKAGERTWVRLGLVDNLGTDGGRAWFDLSNGVIGTVETNGAGSNINATINSIGGGWYRCRFTAQMNNSKTTLQSQVRLATANNVLTYTGDGTSGIYIYGAQLSDSASLDPYVYNFVAAPTSSEYYGPRFDYDPVTLAPKGLLIEEQRINILLNSDTLSTQSVSVTAQAYTLSFYGTGSVALSGAYTGSLVGTGVYPNRAQLTFTPAIGTLTLTVTGSVRYANLEAGSFPTSYIPTTSTQVTRTADNASMVGTNFSSWYNQSEGTVVAEYDRLSNITASGVPRTYSITDGTLLNEIDLRQQSGSGEYFAIAYAGASQASIANIVVTAGNPIKTASSYATNNVNSATNTTLGVNDNLATIPSVTRLDFGNRFDGLRPLNGHIKSFKFFSKRFINTYLQSLTQ